MKVTTIPLVDIHCDSSFNCRGPIPLHTIKTLAADIEENGLLQPIIVRPHTVKPFQVIAGHRRYLAHQHLKRDTIPAIIRTDISETQARAINLKENLERQELNILQEARALEPFKTEGWTINRIVKELGVNRPWVELRLMLLDLEPDLQIQAAAGLIKGPQIRQLWSTQDRAERKKLAQAWLELKLSGEVQRRIRRDPFALRERGQVQLKRMLAHVREQKQGYLVERVLAWATGEISEADLYKDFAKTNKDYQLPEEFKGIL